MNRDIMINNFCEILQKRAKPKSIGKCGQFVRIAFEGASNIDIRETPNAKNYVDIFYATGLFIKLEFTTHDNFLSNYIVSKGDIAFFQDGEYGHACGYDGKYWISDFVQNGASGIYAKQSRKANKVQPIILRWK